MNDIFRSAEELRKDNKIRFEGKNPLSSTFWHYTSIESANAILNSKSFHVGSLDKMNDLDECRLHERDKDFVHALCFCNSDTEKIPMWYLYSGIAGRGCSIGFTPSKMKELITSIKSVRALVENKDNAQNKDKENEKTLVVGSDVTFDCGWVYYQKKESPTQICYKRKWYNVDDVSAFQENNYYIKSYPWEYEKEFRITFTNHTAKKYDKLVVDIPKNLLPSLKIKFAPEVDEQTVQNLAKTNDGFLQYLNTKYQKSQLSIHMDLLARNHNGLCEYIRQRISDREKQYTVDEFCEMIKPSGECKKA